MSSSESPSHMPRQVLLSEPGVLLQELFANIGRQVQLWCSSWPSPRLPIDLWVKPREVLEQQGLAIGEYRVFPEGEPRVHDYVALLADLDLQLVQALEPGVAVMRPI